MRRASIKRLPRRGTPQGGAIAGEWLAYCPWCGWEAHRPQGSKFKAGSEAQQHHCAATVTNPPKQ